MRSNLERGIPLPIIQVNLIEGRPPEKIKALIENITDTVVETLDAPRESVRVLVTELPKTNWGIAGVPASERK
ncbi:4-oxalocrotonate tautomerase [Neobacillus niacini]|uniref:4-oxalocrotonate tautomerase n=1 Tax=Neobacillus niacini TaxID=86668 RepID=UPI002DB70A54|nr:4-oxalocrotonate tautomerase [Neobacillus niacini]